ncbi:hypothetical protein HSR122_1136 [Halapricum desulfuricans]|uniref:Uncharacterized protein n=1 Tax=Halapricum desulfuricans TaxID=2841257 RepID=A0A897N759_9EURY|nr:hypothetical protein HSR122_1136 [Halapricum desulfuricans]
MGPFSPDVFHPAGDDTPYSSEPSTGSIIVIIVATYRYDRPRAVDPARTYNGHYEWAT